MEVKGTAVKSVPEFVQKHFPVRYQEWLNSMPDDSKKLMGGLLFSNNWYPLKESLTVPMKAISKLFYSGDDKKTARIMGQYSATIALSGVYRFFIQFGSPKFIIERGGRVFSTYFQPSEMVVINVQKNSLSVHITKFPEPETIIEQNIAGWMEKALEISGCRQVRAEVTKSMVNKAPYTEIQINWI
jgi:hypothetical protein